ncbi:MAG: c-type cytochrome [Planctomycetaceae bacterium]|nr:c-type cytochrome [Planctomycetaceae bacterium]
MFRFLLTTGLFLSTSSVMAQQVWTQKTESQPSQLYGAAEVPEVKKPTIPDGAFSGGAVPKWIWGNNNDAKYVLIKSVELPKVQAARLKASTDNSGTVFINGKRVGSSSEWQEPIDVDVTSSLVAGKNRIEAVVENGGGVAAFVLKLVVQTEDGKTIEVVSDDSWTWDLEKGKDSNDKVELRGTYGDGPWGLVFNNTGSEGRVPPGVFEVLPGFAVEKVFTVPKDELGSWVCITFDNKGRLLASDQGDLGICRVTLPGNAEGSEAKVERVDFSKCEIKPTAAQGMLWAFDSLYFSINGGPGSGLYRARDKDGDDSFDECVKLKEFRGGGEHGPHALRLSPDGKRLFVICGNHTLPPFNAGDELTNKDYTSRIPTNWSEDHILPRMWDANGHARGIMAPGGWIASTDPDGKTWDIWSVGYRNPYDMAFNADGELFAYDADMEWDVGMPWYRPTRVVHATSGSEFGWRSGSGKWPNHYIDSLPPLVNIGPGCPVGVEFGYGTKFPAKYQKALFICDWTFGTMYAIHMDPTNSTYTGVKEEFLSRTPLPLTDVAVGPDGMLYFSIGGRGTQSELFRVRYTGSESTAPANLHDEKGAGPRSRRHVVESWHAGRNGDTVQPRVSTDVFIAGLESDVRSGDRFLKSAAREAFYNSQLFLDLLSASELESADMSQGPPEDRLSIVVTLAKAPLKVLAKEKGLTEAQVTEQEEKLHRLTTKMLSQIKFSSLTVEQKLIYLRALSLVCLRLGPPTAEQREQFVADIDGSFPSNNMDLDRELCQVLIYLKSPTIIGKTVALLEAPSVPTVTDDMKDLLARNRGYGGAIAASIEKAPDQQQIWYAFCLRNAKEGWTMDQRKAYFSWFERAHQWAGGASYHGFLRNIEQECFENASEKERLLIEASGARKPYTLPEIPKPAGPGKEWTLEEVRALAENGLKNRNFENGQKMFAATRCVICHRFAGDGGATGPDLTQLAGRFNVKDLTEAIMEPSKVISDQYKGSTVVTTSGKSFSGRIVAENENSVTVLTNPEDPTKITEIPKSEVDEILPAKVSIMPADLLKPLNQDEVLDLLAYLLSRGDKGSGMFKR